MSKRIKDSYDYFTQPDGIRLSHLINEEEIALEIRDAIADMQMREGKARIEYGYIDKKQRKNSGRRKKKSGGITPSDLKYLSNGGR